MALLLIRHFVLLVEQFRCESERDARAQAANQRIVSLPAGDVQLTESRLEIRK